MSRESAHELSAIFFKYRNIYCKERVNVKYFQGEEDSDALRRRKNIFIYLNLRNFFLNTSASPCLFS